MFGSCVRNANIEPLNIKPNAEIEDEPRTEKIEA